MAKGKTTVFFCQSCGFESSKWLGQCPGCKEWNTFVEEQVNKKILSGAGKMISKTEVVQSVPLSDIKTDEEVRTGTGFVELDRVLGGGIVQGSLVLVGGDPGIGKSTLLLQMCKNLSDREISVLYVSGEESLRQIKLRAERIGTFRNSLKLLCETNLEDIRQVLEKEKPEVVIIDSIQTMYNEEVSSAPGSVSQVREATAAFMQMAKGMGITIFIVGSLIRYPVR